MIFDWHDEKSEACRRRRGFGFDYAARIFSGDIWIRIDGRRDYGEVRLQALGEIDGFPYVVVFTERRNASGEIVYWIISARRAYEKECRQWRNALSRN
ncbi:BrnT family toxin [Methylobacterium organophilum]|uniref:BrnT family toxin n=1 Tax=Methylobacterium organophilum TaxID=410 RepID=UPI001F14836A|nr:BrnT family toxin [Methylobacterium organophilum]UMY18014.1 BrnT family toxin [Methylobacterium organophilum]